MKKWWRRNAPSPTCRNALPGTFEHNNNWSKLLRCKEMHDEADFDSQLTQWHLLIVSALEEAAIMHKW